MQVVDVEELITELEAEIRGLQKVVKELRKRSKTKHIATRKRSRRSTRNKFVIETLKASEEPLRPTQIVERLRERGQEIPSGTVRNILSVGKNTEFQRVEKGWTLANSDKKAPEIE